MYHCMTWWGHSHRVHSVLTGMVSSSLLNTLHRLARGSGDDRDTGRSLRHKHLTVTHLGNRNTLDRRGNIRVRKKEWTLWLDPTEVIVELQDVESKKEDRALTNVKCTVRWLTGAAQRIGVTQTVVASLTLITAGTFNVHFTLTRARDVVTPAPIHCPLSTAHTAWEQHNNTDMSHSSWIVSTYKYFTHFWWLQFELGLILKSLSDFWCVALSTMCVMDLTN